MAESSDDFAAHRDELRKRVLLRGLKHWFNIEAPPAVGAFLSRAGMLSSESATELVPEFVVRAIRDPSHPSHLDIPPGAVVLVREEEGAIPEIVPVLHLLSVPQQDAREAAVCHLQREATPMAPNSRRVISEYAAAMRSSEATAWLPAAMRVTEVLQSDFHLNLACLQVGWHLSNNQLLQEAWHRLMQCSLESILSIQTDSYRLLVAGESPLGAVKASLKDAVSLCDAVNRFDDLVGHIPLHPECDAGIAIASWLEQAESIDLNTELVELAGSGLDAAGYVATVAIGLEKYSDLSRSTQEWCRDALRGLVAPRSDTHIELQRELLLRIEADCARYYFRFIETRVENLDVTRMATVSWWAARAIARAVEDQAGTAQDPVDFLSKFHEALLLMVERGGFEWHAVHPRAGHGSARYGTLSCARPRIMALLCRLRSRRDDLTAKLDSTAVEAITQMLTVHQFQYHQVRDDGRQRVWVFDEPIEPLFTAWIGSVAPPERGGLEGLVRVGLAARDTKRIANEMKELVEIPEPVGSACAQLFRGIVYSEAEAQPLWELVMDTAWRTTWFDQLGPDAMGVLFDGIVELSRRVEDERAMGLAHIFAEQHERHLGDVERRSCFFGLTVLAAAATNGMSAVRRLATCRIKDRDAQSIEDWRARIRSMLGEAPGRLKGTLRDVLSSLRP